MNFLKKILSSALSCSIILSSAVGSALVTNCYADDAQPPAVFTMEDSDYAFSSEITTTETTAPDNVEDTTSNIVTTTTTQTAQPIVVTVVTTATTPNENQNTEPSFDVFEIYVAHSKYMATLTTTTTTTSTIKTTTTTKSIAPTEVGTGIKGIDVSKWQGDIDWNKVKADGINFAIIRAGYGKLASQKDPKFDTNVTNAKKAGINCGVYWYSYATTVEEAYQEAEACYSIIKGYSFEYPIVFDIEDDSQRDLSTATISAIIDAFCSTLQDKGYYVSLYSYASFLTTKVYSSVLQKYDIWVAHYYVSKPNFTGSYGIWQYTDLGKINGISENVDMNYAYKDYPYIISKMHKNGY